jgi:Icc-related predicted phosphoesterase
VRIAAASDVHGDQFFQAFEGGLSKLPEVDLFLLLGDLTHRNDAAMYDKVMARVSEIDAPRLVLFGNNEWTESFEGYRQKYAGTFLNDDAHSFGSGGERARFVGTTGSLDEPTWWQSRNVPGIRQTYARRVERVDELLDSAEPTILLTHYPPTHVTMGGEKPPWRPQLGSLALEDVVKRRNPVAVVHGHVHKGVPYAEIGGGQTTLEGFAAARPIPVFNVAVPVTGGITLLEYGGGVLRAAGPPVK